MTRRGGPQEAGHVRGRPAGPGQALGVAIRDVDRGLDGNVDPAGRGAAGIGVLRAVHAEHCPAPGAPPPRERRFRTGESRGRPGDPPPRPVLTVASPARPRTGSPDSNPTPPSPNCSPGPPSGAHGGLASSAADGKPGEQPGSSIAELLS